MGPRYDETMFIRRSDGLKLEGDMSEEVLGISPFPLLDEGEIYEVFQLDQREPLPHHGGNLRAPDAELARHYAREFYGRRQESQQLWIIPRTALRELRIQTPLPTAVQLFGDGEHADYEPQEFVIFGQKQSGHPLLWLQNLAHLHPSEAEELVKNIAQDTTTGIIRLWLCPRRAILLLDNQDLLQPPLDRSYRRLDGYTIREKLRRARQRVKTQEGSTSCTN
jgi:hypothetical protein